MSANHPDHLIEILKARRFRITAARKEILTILCKTKHPISAIEIGERLKTLELPVNKTTVYRELEFLKQEGIASEVDFGDLTKRYEIKSHEHRHHLVCTKCNRIEDVILENDLEVLEAHIKKTKKFKVLHHSLEFFGLCSGCQ